MTTAEAKKQADLGLVRYDAMCLAIAECHRVDEVKDIRDKMVAIEAYAKQARNLEAENRAAEIRIRAERRAGELLREMKQVGGRAAREANLKLGRNSPKSSLSTSGKMPTCAPTLKDLGISKDQSSKWQQLANVPAEEFERAVNGLSGVKPSTEGIINAAILKHNPAPRMDEQALWLWGRMRDFERNGIMERNFGDLIDLMTDSMRDDCERLLPRILRWMKR